MLLLWTEFGNLLYLAFEGNEFTEAKNSVGGDEVFKNLPSPQFFIQTLEARKPSETERTAPSLGHSGGGAGTAGADATVLWSGARFVFRSPCRRQPPAATSLAVQGPVSRSKDPPRAGSFIN